VWMEAVRLRRADDLVRRYSGLRGTAFRLKWRAPLNS